MRNYMDEEGITFEKYEPVKGEEPKCFLCGAPAGRELFRSPVPKELTEPNEIGILFENLHPMCKDCFEFKKELDINFIELCKAVKFFELYRTTSKKQSEYFPQQLVFHVDKKELLELYYTLLGLAEKSWKQSGDKEWEKWMRDQLNYYWRKKDV